jgi:hypothetical protein
MATPQAEIANVMRIRSVESAVATLDPERKTSIWSSLARTERAMMKGASRKAMTMKPSPMRAIICAIVSPGAVFGQLYVDELPTTRKHVAVIVL